MSTSRPSEHRDAILDQFTRQAIPFATAPGIKDEAALRLVVEFAGAGPEDTGLDVACGPGLLACAFARVVRHMTGIDLTPATLERARAWQRECGLTNVTWRQGDVLALPYADASFSIVTARYAFHHFLDPLAELKDLFPRAGLTEPRVTCYRLESDLESLLARSFPRPEDVPEIRRIFAQAVEDDRPDIRARRDGGTTRYGYPVAILAATRS